MKSILSFLRKRARAWCALSAWQQILIALVLGLITGVCLGERAVYIKPIGALFINAIHMIVAPVVFTAIVTAILSLSAKEGMARVTLRAFVYYVILMMLSAGIGCVLSYYLAPGGHFHPAAMDQLAPVALQAAPLTLASFIEHLLPSNPVVPFLQGNVLQLILFAVLFAAGVRMAKGEADPVRHFFLAMNKVVYQLTAMIISAAPYGIFSLIAWTVGHYGVKVLTPLLSLVATVYLGCFILLFVVYGVGLLLLARKSPWQFYRAIFPALAFAFTSSSSAATLPITLQCAEKKLAIPMPIARFLLPLGTSFNLNGLSIYLSVATCFAANIYGIHLGFSQLVTMVLTITVTAMGAAAVPGSALIVMGAVMSALGVPLNAIALIAGVDRLNDMMQTATNVAGDVFVALAVSNDQPSS